MNHVIHEYSQSGETPPVMVAEAATTKRPAPVDPSILAMLEEIQEPGQPDLICELIELFLEDSARNLQALETAVEHRNAAEVRLVAHSLKGSSGSLGAMSVTKQCSELEAIVPSEGWSEIQQMLVKLKVVCAEANQFFHAELKRRSQCAS